MKILFQGDSVTDAGRNYSDPDDLGPGYCHYTAQILQDRFPSADFEFVNRGISGNRVIDLVNRFDSDFIAIKPDIVTILIGVNDSWHRYGFTHKFSSNASFEKYYRYILESLKQNNVTIFMIEPFSLPNDCIPKFRSDLLPKIDIVRKLAREYAVKYLPTDGLLAADSVINGLTHLTDDGVHPNEEGRKWLGSLLADLMTPTIQELIK